MENDVVIYDEMLEMSSNSDFSSSLKQFESISSEGDKTQVDSKEVGSLYSNKSKFLKRYYSNTFNENTIDISNQINSEENHCSEPSPNFLDNCILHNQKIMEDLNLCSNKNSNQEDVKNIPENVVDSTTSSSDTEKHDMSEELKKEVRQLKLCLEEKEKQLEMAAEYGIKLLQDNESLQTLLNKKEEEGKVKIEEVMNAQHMLKMQLECEGLEHQSITQELKNDLANFSGCLEVERKHLRDVEKELNERVRQLTISNEALTDQILNASLQEEESVSRQMNLRLRVSEGEAEQQHQVSILQSEISDLREEMERRLRLKAEECRLLSTSLDHAHERLHSMEKERISETLRAEQLQGELMRLEDKYVVLLSKSDEAVEEQRGGTNFNEMSLFAELDVLSDAVHAHELINGKGCMGAKSFPGTQLRQEILEVYRQVQRLIMEVKGQGHLWSPEVVDISDLKAGQLLFSLTQLHQLLNRRFHTDSLPPLMDEQSKVEKQMAGLKEQASTLRQQLTSNQKTLERLKEEVCLRDQQLQRSHDHRTALEAMLQQCRHEVSSLQSRLDAFKTAAVPQDTMQAVAQAWSERDQAVKRSGCLEEDLLMLRLDMKQLDRQLMELVEQKLHLSNQLEAWQNDMHELLESKMAGEMERDSLKPRQSLSSSSKPPKTNSLKKRFSLKWS